MADIPYIILSLAIGFGLGYAIGLWERHGKSS